MAAFDTAREGWSAVTKTPFCGRAYHTATLVGTKIWVVSVLDPRPCFPEGTQPGRWGLLLQASYWEIPATHLR